MRSAEDIARTTTDKPELQAEIIAAINRWRDEDSNAGDGDMAVEASAFAEGWLARQTWKPVEETVHQAYDRLGPKLAEATLYLEDNCTWWRLEQESANLYRFLAAETPAPGPITSTSNEGHILCYEAASLDEVLDQLLENGLPWVADVQEQGAPEVETTARETEE